MVTASSSPTHIPSDTPPTEIASSSSAELAAIASTSSSRLPIPPSLSTAEHVDLLFKRWTAAVAKKMRRKKGKGALGHDGEEDPPPLNKDEEVEVWRSVFERWAPPSSEGKGGVKGKGKQREVEGGVPEMDHDLFMGLVEDVRTAIASGIHPKLNSKGSSGSYFARSPTAPHQTLGIFKPADEDPYAALNPKWLKWLHRNFLSRLIPFGRSCLVNGQSYISEAAASTLDRMLGTVIVPRTEAVSLASPAFYYDWIDRERAARRGGQLREKEGSFQVFLKGYTDASDFLSRHPYPGRPIRSSSSSSDPSAGLAKSQKHRHNRRHRARGCLSCLLCLCGRAGAEQVLDEELGEGKKEGGEAGEDGFEWTEEVVESLREGLEGLVILDFLIRNTDRGLDNFMLKACSSCEPPAAWAVPSAAAPSQPSSSTGPSPNEEADSHPHLHLAAIDNSLAFPHTHPSGWRRYPYGWLYLPLSLIGRPWSKETREKFLPKLSDSAWWMKLKVELRKEFMREAKGKGKWREETFEKQFALVKGQGLLLVESLRSENEGPVELVRRPKKLVFDDYILVPADEESSLSAPRPPVPDFPGPLSFGQAADAVLDSPSSPPRPPLHEQHSEPTKPSSSSSPSTAIPTAKKAGHRRTVSSTDYYTFTHRFFPPPQATPSRPTRPSQAPILATTTRSPDFSVSISGATSFPAAEAAQLRKPLDALSASLGRPAALFSHSKRDSHDAAERGELLGETDVDGAEAEEEEETGVSLMRRLDQVEEKERKRLKRVEKDTAARAALDLASHASPDDGKRRTFSHGGSAEAGAGGVGKNKPWGLFRRAASEEHASLSHERSPLLGGTVDALYEQEEEDEEDMDEERAVQSDITPRLPAGVRGMSMSWFGRTLDGVEEGGEGRQEEPEAGKIRGKKRKWVVVERIEHVKEPKRHWWMWDW